MSTPCENDRKICRENVKEEIEKMDFSTFSDEEKEIEKLIIMGKKFEECQKTKQLCDKKTEHDEKLYQNVIDKQKELGLGGGSKRRSKRKQRRQGEKGRRHLKGSTTII